MTVSSFAKTLGQNLSISKDGDWVVALFRSALAQCLQTTPAGSQNFTKEPLKTVREALFQLSSTDKIVLLLRDQCHFSFEVIAEILGMSVQESRSECLAARERLRGAVKEILDKSSGTNHVV